MSHSAPPGRRSAVVRAVMSGILFLVSGGRAVWSQPVTLPPGLAHATDTARLRVLTKLRNVAMNQNLLFMSVAEYHDEQKLPIPTGLGDAYGPMVRTFAVPSLSGYTHRSQFEDAAHEGQLVALVDVDWPVSAPMPGTYQDLGLSGGTNCVFLAHDHAVANDLSGWSAYIVKATVPTATPNAPPECKHGFLPVAAPTVRKVIAERTASDNSFFDYPLGARIQFDPNGRAVIGVKCMRAWCEIGSPGIVATPPIHAGDAALNSKREGRVKGWHDEQRLAVMIGSVLRPSTLVASLTPKPNLDELGDGDFTSAAGVEVATVWLGRDPNTTTEKKYRDNWKFRQGSNKVFLRGSGANWQAWVMPAGGGTAVPLRVIRTPHPDIAVPGSARWRWNPADEGMWIRCGNACCEVEL